MKPEQHGTYLRWWHPENPSRELLLLAFQNCTRYIVVLLYAERYKLSLDVFYDVLTNTGHLLLFLLLLMVITISSTCITMNSADKWLFI